MDSDEEEVNTVTQKYQKDAKIGEGTYAVVYRGNIVVDCYTMFNPF
jgi:cyclin-dependent kinase 7